MSPSSTEKGRGAHTAGPYRVAPLQGGEASIARGKTIQAELPCINGLRAWFTLAYVYERDDEERLFTEGAIGSAEDDARLFAASHDYAAAVQQMLFNEDAGGEGWWKGWEMLKAAHSRATGESSK